MINEFLQPIYTFLGLDLLSILAIIIIFILLFKD